MNLALKTIQSGRYICISSYALPLEVQHLYNGRVFDLLIQLPVFGEDPELFIPSWLRCRIGNPIHLNLPAPQELAAHGWKKACWEIIGGWKERYSTAALLNMIDKFFRGYPYAP